ncbi:hypothetical protein [Flavobacterium frigoris]|uniref:PKD domain-containing protein n=1 Tax=Flavobacterium frigoris TaxID=229204 RepID=A0A1H9HDI2_FLAFI|nr:hypothetical protein [Flavobacterium frigoris]SEQ60246.1 hypothetical protein SAMN05444355_103101 [Flavobacterium frigoris]
MKLNIILKRSVYLMFIIATLGSLTCCQPDTIGEGNGLTDSNVDATFTFTPVAEKTNTYKLMAQTQSVILSKWDTGDGLYIGKMNEEISLPDAGTYQIRHVAVGRGGSENTTIKEIIVATSDPLKGNLVQGGNFANATDHAKWKVMNLSPSGAAKWTFKTGSAIINSNGGWSQEAIYQAIDVVKDKEYKIDMLVSSQNGSDETWFEVYAGTTVPESGVEYKDNRVMGLSTWDGCAKAAFSGKLSMVGCVKNQIGSISNVVKFSQTGKIYLVFRSGGNIFTSSGITIAKVEFRGV